jgi:TonB family protein
LSPIVALILAPLFATQEAPQGVVTPPAIKTFVPAQYPPEISDARTATVTVAIQIEADGLVSNVEVVASGGPEFDREAIAAAKQLVFEPAKLDGVPVPVRILYRYAFTVTIEKPTGPVVSFEGWITDGATKQPIEGLTVEITDIPTSTLTRTTTVTNAEGYFAFTDLPPGYHQVRVSGPGYVAITFEQAISADEKAQALVPMEALDKAAGEMDLVEVIRAPRVRKEIAQTRIAAAEGRKIPGTQGDTVKVVENMGGVGRAAAGSGELVVWGASPSDTRSYVDGVLVPRLFHLGGSRSVVASEMVAAVDLVPGGFGADYGRAVGGLIRVETTQPKEESGVHGQAALDLIDASLGARTKLSEKWSISAGARKSILDQTFGAFADERAQELIPIPSYWDYQTKLTYAPKSGDTLSLLVFGSNDSVSRQTPSTDPTMATSETTQFGFHRVAVRLDRLLPDGSSLEVVPWVGVDTNQKTSNFGGVSAGLEQTTVRGAVRASERRRIADFATLRSGLDVEGSHASIDRSGALTLPAREGDIVAFGIPPGDRTNVDSWQVSTGGVGAHATLELELFDEALIIEPGVRFELTMIDGDRVLPVRGREPPIGYTEIDLSLDPRLRVAWHVLDELTVHGALGVYHQAPDAADLSPVFGSPVLELIAGIHSLAGVKIEPFEGTSFELTGFLVQLSEIPVRSRLPTPPQAAALASTGQGKNFGGQLTFKQKFSEGLFGWVTYSLMRAERRDSADAAWRVFDADQTHNLSIVGSWAVGAGFELGARFRYASGFPRTPVTSAFYNARSGSFDPVYGAQNSLRLPDFIDLSLRVGYSLTLDWAKLEAFLDVQNVINRNNPEEIIYTSDFTSSAFISGTPVLPVIGLRIEL